MPLGMPAASPRRRSGRDEKRLRRLTGAEGRSCGRPPRPGKWTQHENPSRRDEERGEAGRRPGLAGRDPSCRMEKAGVWAQDRYTEAAAVAGPEDGKPSHGS